MAEVNTAAEGGYSRMHKQDALLLVQDVCSCAKWSMQAYVEEFPCPRCNMRPHSHNYVVDTVNFMQTVDEILGGYKTHLPIGHI